MAKQIIYQVLTRLWGSGKMEDWDEPQFRYLKSLQAGWVWYTGIPRHATGKPFVKGDPGSPYAVSDWYDVNPYLAVDPSRRLDEFRDLVVRTHGAGLKVMTDFIPNHVARDYEGAIAHHCWCDGDWTDTFKNDYSSPATVPACIDILCFWASLGVDGFRCDMVELVPAEAMKAIIECVRARFPQTFFVAEVYGRENYWKYIREVGFDLLYDKSGSYDILRRVICSGGSCSDSVSGGPGGPCGSGGTGVSGGDARDLTRNWQGLQDLQPAMLNFLENHDEQRLASPWFAGSAAKGYAALAFSALFNDASFMLYFGQEVGECAAEGHEGRTSIFEWSRPALAGALSDYASTGRGLPMPARSVLSRYRRLLALASRPVFRSGSNWDLCYCQPAGSGFPCGSGSQCCSYLPSGSSSPVGSERCCTTFDPSRHFAFLRYDSAEAWVVFCNFSGAPAALELTVPAEALGQIRSVAVQAAPWDYVAVRLQIDSPRGARLVGHDD